MTSSTGGVLEPDRPEPRATGTPEYPMAHLPAETPTTFRSGLGGATGGVSLEGVLGALADTSPIALIAYLLARQIIPALLVVCMTRGATPTERVALVQTYLGAAHRRRRWRADQAEANPEDENGSPVAGGG